MKNNQKAFTPLEKITNFNPVRKDSFSNGVNRRSSLTGFTLIEILLGLTIFSIIAVSLYSTFSSGIQLSRRSDDSGRIYREATLIFDRLATDLQSAQYYSFDNSYPQLLAFAGAGDQLTFFVPSEKGLRSVSYFLRDPQNDFVYKTIIAKRSARPQTIISNFEEKESRDLLVREERPFVDFLQQSPEPSPDREILSSRIQEGSLKFSYAYLKKQGEALETVWQDSWSLHYPPSGVRVTLTFVNSEKSKGPVTLTRDLFIPAGFLGEESP